eukprot:CAMPEP_0113628244 /NCGR_PEP_ID=MMETSP0017_2-20120614/14633_1 /TAXON_ID=2856 /ORGANISM="Cylindrotheca closterium" /LENGTH=234 /DNA_ID=CAMNT_0000538539 /DNA_START=26 /DNA_END=730 /DNA_ORIENTATION=- /assembly_acc=CAM_ASM_000147
MMAMETPAASQQAGDALLVPKKFPKSLEDALPPPLPRAAELLFSNSTAEKKLYWDRSHYESPDSQMKALAISSTLYIGNLAFFTRSAHIRSHFGQIGPVKNVQMGLDRFLKTPCGFCFVEYHSRKDALQAVANLSGTKLDGRVIRVELDAGFQPGRQYGRGVSGGQVRDDRRNRSDPARSAKRQKQLNWTPPPGVSNDSQKDSTHYGGNAGDKPEQSENTMDDHGDKNPRFRED